MVTVIQFEVPARNRKQTILVGWDSDRETYYMLVMQGALIIDQAGTEVGEIHDVEVLDRRVKRHSKAVDGLSPQMYKALFDAEDLPEIEDEE